MNLSYFFSLLFIGNFLVAANTDNGSDASFQQLMEGNQRYVNGDLKEKREELVDGQYPFAVVLGCSDSRVPPEIVFDQGLGDLFVVRVAGNIADPVGMDSITYAVEVLQVPFILVLGHQNCGAVQAVLEGKADENDLAALVPFIRKSVNQSKKIPGDPLVNAIKENVRETIRKLEARSDLKKAIKNKNLKIIGGYYNLDSGKVEIVK